MAEDRLEDALRAARMYYFQDLTMEAIAREMRTSRSTVSRLITYAKAAGIIEFRLHTPHERVPGIEQRLSSAYGIVAHVVPVPETATELETLDQVARFSARLLNTLFDSDMILGIAWGTTVNAVSKHLVAKATTGSQVVQLNGAGNTRTTGIDYASQIVHRFGAAYGARVQQFPVPTLFDYPETKRALWRERSILRVLNLQQRADVVLFGIGAVEGGVPSHVYSAGYLERRDFTAIKQAGVVGDVATVFYRLDGSHDGISLNDRASGPDLALLRKVRHRMCVVAGENKLLGLRGALAAGLVSELVIDEASASALVTALDVRR
ncbi:sugar-binding transcriptional regulator [Acidothermaceae bacterium B102]|nr:sugar-binding transcriptional regulator [Acidothermaceae bacterium B102]